MNSKKGYQLKIMEIEEKSISSFDTVTVTKLLLKDYRLLVIFFV